MTAVISMQSTANAQPEITVVPRPPTAGRNLHYTSNRPPLAPSPLIKLPLGAIAPKGWIRTQLVLMKEGITGKLAEVSPWLRPENNAWLSPTGVGDNGWEELPYWLKGFTDLGYILNEEPMIGHAKAWLEGVMASQRPDGYFGPESNRLGGPDNRQIGVAGKLKAPDLWPHMLMIDALRSYYEATSDPRVLTLLTRYFKWQDELPQEQLLAASWQKIRGGDNLDSILWLYNRTGDSWLLDLAHKVHAQTSPWSQKIASWHGVNFCQGYREPGVYWMLSQDPKDLEAVERNYREVMGLYGQVPGGMFGSDEVCRKGYGDPRQAAETCSMVEFMASFEQLLRITGDGLQADRCEEVAFNSLPAAFTPDYKALHYLTSPNMVQLDKENKAPGIMNSGTMISYDPGPVYRCCQHNHAMGWPYYAEHLWMATADNGLAAVLYGPSAVSAKVGPAPEGESEAAQATIVQDTSYPFGEILTFTVTMSRPAAFPIYLRIPQWCTEAQVQVTGSEPAAWSQAGSPGAYARINRTWRSGDVIRLVLPMQIEARTWRANKNSVSIKRGPLWYSLKIGERYEQYQGSSSWPAFEIYPSTPWNYGLIYNPADVASSFRVTQARGPFPDQPFDAAAAPVRLTAKGRRIPAWQQDRLGLVGLLQESPVKSDEPVETLTLIPMGAARLRIAAFPVIGDGPDAKPWPEPPPVRHEASFANEDPAAVSDGQEPRSSADHDAPRFTWWNHKGTTEWITYKLGEPRKVSSVSVYWFDDTGIGQCRLPEAWTLFYKVGNAWKEVSNASGYGVDPDHYNRTTFDPVTTGELKLQVKLQDGFSGGILEWKVGP